MSHTTSDARKRAAEHQCIPGCEPDSHLASVHGFHDDNGCAKCVGAGWQPPTTVPRVARSLEDLRVGQVVVTRWAASQGDTESWDSQETFTITEEMLKREGGGRTYHWEKRQTIILADPPEPDYLVPRAVMERLRDVIDNEVGTAPELTVLGRAARDVLMAATEVEDR